jgi:MinD-like ATPase involved in chromosome partitioning or flagellar assembly
VLVDADEVAPCLAQRLGQPPYPNIRAAIDALEHRTARLSDVLIPVPAGRFALMPGLSNPRSWTELRPTETVEVIRALSLVRRQVVVNVGSRLEDLHSLGGPARHGIARSLVATADLVVAVAQPTPVGLGRLLDWLADLRALTSTAPVHVVFNRATTGAFKQGELTEELTRTFTPSTLWFVPSDARVEAAAWSGDLPASGPFTKAVAAITERVLPPAGAATAGRRRLGPLRRIERRTSA